MLGARSLVLDCREPQTASGSVQREPRGEPRAGFVGRLAADSRAVLPVLPPFPFGLA
jgi:hypothetical protein